MNTLLKCGFCNNQIDDPFMLLCGHIFCKTCLISNDNNGKLTCANCKTVHSGGIKVYAKESKLAEFLIAFSNNQYDKTEHDPLENEEIEDKCAECPPPPPPPKKVKPEDPDPPKVPLPKVKICFHCKKKLCKSCREKHYHTTRMEVIKILEDYQNGSTNLISTSEKLNDARQQKVLEYSKYKSDIKTKKIELVKRLEQEEHTLLAQLDKEISEEKQNIENTKGEMERISSNKEAQKAIKAKFSDNGLNKKVLCLMSTDLKKAQSEWESQLKNQANRSDPEKEMRLVYTETKLKDSIIGNLEMKKGKLGINKAEIPNTAKSSVCTIL